MNDQQRPQLTERARRLLENIKDEFTYKIIHEAEKHTLKENRGEISEADMQEAKRIFRAIPESTSKRKWTVRVAIAVFLAFLLLHFEAFSELSNIPLSLQIRLYLPTIALFAWLLLFSYFFREDWS